MKKLIAITLLAVSAMTASAQMMTSRSLMKRETPTTWYVRLGMSINSLNGLSRDDKDNGMSTGSKAGFDVDFGFNKPIGKSGAYWGMELGIGNRGGSINEEDTYDDEEYKTSINTWSLKYSPITLGYKYSLTDDIRLDGHIGAFALVDISRKAKCDGEELEADEVFSNRFDAGLQVGIGAWYKKINIDFTYQHGFIAIVEPPYSTLKTSALVIRLGYAF